VAFAGVSARALGPLAIFAAFKSRAPLRRIRIRRRPAGPFDKKRNGIVVSEGGCIYTMERLEDAVARGARIYGEVGGIASTPTPPTMCCPTRCGRPSASGGALAHAGLEAADIDIVNTHATATPQGGHPGVPGDPRGVAGCEGVNINNTKSFIGPCHGGRRRAGTRGQPAIIQ